MIKKLIKIDIVSDVVCPWCYIGKRRIEKAMQKLEDLYEFNLSYHPFELNPYLPSIGVDQREHLIQKFGSQAKYEQLTSNVTKVAALDGIAFKLNEQPKTPNTLKAHILISIAKSSGVQIQLVERYFEAYFTKRIDLTNDETLIRIAVETGLDENIVRNSINNKDKENEIRLEQEYYRKLGVSGVPFYIINDKYAISGAQQPEAFIEAISEIGKEASTEGNSCSIDDKNC